MNLDHAFCAPCRDREDCDWDCEACRRHRQWFYNYRRTRYSVDDRPVRRRGPFTLWDVLPMVRRYLAADSREMFAECGRFRVHGMKDVVGLIRGYMRRTAVSFGFDGEGTAWILWKDGEMYCGPRGAPRNRCFTIVEPKDYLNCEIRMGNGAREVVFTWLDREERHSWRSGRVVVAMRNRGSSCSSILVLQDNSVFREYIFNRVAHEVSCSGVSCPWPKQYLTMRNWKLIVYGLLPNGELETVPHPEHEGVY